MKMQVFGRVSVVWWVRTGSTGGSVARSCLLCLACSTNSLRSAGITLGSEILLLAAVCGACLCFKKFFPLEFSAWRSLGCGTAVALLCHLLSPFLPLIFICPCLSCPSLRQKQNALCGCKPGVPNTLNNCSTARVNVKHKSASKFPFNAIL